MIPSPTLKQFTVLNRSLFPSLCVRDCFYTLNHVMCYMILYVCLYRSQPSKWHSSSGWRFSQSIREKKHIKYYKSNSTQYDWSVISSFNDFSLFVYDNPWSSIQKYSAKYLFILFTNKMCSSAFYPHHSKCYSSMWWTEIMKHLKRQKVNFKTKNKDLPFSCIFVEVNTILFF